MPRTMSDPIWMHWTEAALIGSNAKQRVYCRYCREHEQLRNAPKCKKHTMNCKKTPISIRRRFREEFNARQMNIFYKQKEIDIQIQDNNSDIEEDSESRSEEVGVDPHVYNISNEQLGPTVRVDPQVFNYSISKVELDPIVQHVKHSFKRERDISHESQNAKSIVRYIDTFHRVKEDMNYLLNETTDERKREFLSYALEVMAQSLSEEDRNHLNQSITQFCGHS